ncbi:MAG: hypothetical protein ACRD0D_07120 [Acidimicrobiales bacterium]
MRFATLKRRLSESNRLPLAVAGVYAALVVIALAVTWRSVSSEDFDGLNNILQIPLALPWWIVVPAPASHKADAVLTAGLGLVNAGLIYVVLRRYLRRKPAS